MATVMRERRTLQGELTGKPEIVYLITSLSRRQAGPKTLSKMIRGHWGIENSLHYVRDVTYGEDLSRVRRDNGARVMASFRNIAIAIHRLCGEKNIARATRSCSQDSRRAFARLCSRAGRQALKCA